MRGYTLTELENMVPWERHVYIDLIKQDIQEESENARDHQALQNRRR